MNDQERVTDMILSEKKMSTNYNIFASECVDDQLRNEYLNILNKSHQTQTALFKAAQSNGWYTVEQAPQSKITETYNKFNIQKP